MAARSAWVARLNSGLIALGWDDLREAELAASAAASAAPARVVRVDGVSCLVDGGHGDSVAIARPLPSVGDWVATEADGDVLRIVHGLTRRTELARADARRRQILAANVDVVFVTIPLDRPDPLFDVERALVIGLASGCDVVAVLTKADAHPDPARVVSDLRERAPAVDVAVTSAKDGSGVDALFERLQPHRSGVLLGASGAGKSTLTNLLLGDERMSTGATRADGEGRHTTTARRLTVLPQGGVLIDIPGIRTFGLAGAASGIERLYPDFTAASAGCRFTDCAHEGDAGCAVAEVAASDPAARKRLGVWRMLGREAAAFDEAEHARR